MNLLWGFMILIGGICGAVNGGLGTLTEQILSSVAEAVNLSIAMAGAIAWEYYKCAKDGKISMEMYCMKEMAMELIPEDMRVIIKEFQHFIKGKVSECKS